MLLDNRGANVTIFEKEVVVDGRNAEIRLGDFRFDTRPTFLMMNFVLEEVFEAVGKNVEDYTEIVDIDPMYRLDFGEKHGL